VFLSFDNRYCVCRLLNLNADIWNHYLTSIPFLPLENEMLQICANTITLLLLRLGKNTDLHQDEVEKISRQFYSPGILPLIINMAHMMLMK
jgi:hypothetical protein